MVLASKKFVAACVQQCKWLPCPGSVSSSEDGSQFEELPAVLAGWSEDAKVRVALILAHDNASSANPARS